MASFSIDFDAIERLARRASVEPSRRRSRAAIVRHPNPRFISVPTVQDIVRDCDGAPLNLTDLPPANFSGYWTRRRKSNVAHAVHGGLLSEQGAILRYAMSRDELDAWKREFLR